MTKTVDLANFERCVVWACGGIGLIAGTFVGLVVFALTSGQGQAPKGAESALAFSLAVTLIALGVALYRSRKPGETVADLYPEILAWSRAHDASCP